MYLRSLRRKTFYVNPATGNDANDGRTPATAWKSWDRLVAAVTDGTITRGSWVTPDGQLADIDTIPTYAAKEAWYAAYLAGQRILTGAHIYIDTSAAPLQVTGPLTLPAGCEIESATDALTNLQVNVPIPATEVWVRPNSDSYPDVWVTTSETNYQWTGLYEKVGGQWAQLLPIGYDGSATTLAAALPKLEATPGSYFVDPATNHLYTHAIAGGNPNADGVARQYVPVWATTLDGRVINVTGGEALRIGGDGGFGFDPITQQAQGAAGIGSSEWNDISIIDSCRWRGPASTRSPRWAAWPQGSSSSATTRRKRGRARYSSAIGLTSSITPASAAQVLPCRFTTATSP